MLPLVVHQKQVEFPVPTDIMGGEELGCSRWSFTRMSVTQVEFPGQTHARTDILGRAQNDKF